MNLTSRTITGGILIVFGICMIVLGLFIFVTIPYGLIALGLGIYIFLNKNEDKIERIKKYKGGK